MQFKRRDFQIMQFLCKKNKKKNRSDQGDNYFCLFKETIIRYLEKVFILYIYICKLIFTQIYLYQLIVTYISLNTLRRLSYEFKNNLSIIKLPLKIYSRGSSVFFQQSYDFVHHPCYSEKSQFCIFISGRYNKDVLKCFQLGVCIKVLCSLIPCQFA